MIYDRKSQREIVQYYQDNKEVSVLETAKKFNVSEYTVSRYLCQAGVKRRGVRRKFKEEVYLEWKRLREEEGWGTTRIAKKYGVKNTNVRKHLKRLGCIFGKK